jgi:hypothetical protein
MLNFNFIIGSPFAEYFRALGCVFGRIGSHWAWEIEHTYYSRELVNIEFKLTRRQDHAGLTVCLGLLGYAVSGRIYDTRDWDDETNSWRM